MAIFKFRLEKAYKNLDFLTSPDARVIRIISEFLEPLRRFRYYNIKDTIVFFGSAKTKPKKRAMKTIKEIKKKIVGKKTKDKELLKELEIAKIDLKISQYYEDAVELSRLLTQWSTKLNQDHRFVVCSGGGPGIMEAANKGAKLAGGKSIGLNISVPFEQWPNKYITPELNFEFHYFFMRKFWFIYLGKALVIFPGGYGTMDELMEVLTLLQTGKIKKKMTVLIYGKEYWDEVINFNAMLKYRTISKDDLKLLHFVNTPQEAFNFLKKDLTKNYLRN